MLVAVVLALGKTWAGGTAQLSWILNTCFLDAEARPRIKTILGLFGLLEWICDGSELGIA
jgi:hypothetical protein